MSTQQMLVSCYCAVHHHAVSGLATLRRPAGFRNCLPNGQRAFCVARMGIATRVSENYFGFPPYPTPTTNSGSQVTAVPIFRYDSVVSSLHKCFFFFNWLCMCLCNHFLWRKGTQVSPKCISRSIPINACVFRKAVFPLI